MGRIKWPCLPTRERLNVLQAYWSPLLHRERGRVRVDSGTTERVRVNTPHLSPLLFSKGRGTNATAQEIVSAIQARIIPWRACESITVQIGLPGFRMTTRRMLIVLSI